MTVLICSLLAVAIFIIDFLIKNHIEHMNMEAAGQAKPLFGGRLLLRRHHNYGAFLNVGERRNSLMAVLSLALTLGVTVLFLVTFTYRGSGILKIGLALLLGGAYSNTYDRLMRKYVVDYISFPVKNKKIRNIVFNISDFCIMIGALLMVIGSTKNNMR